MEKYKGRIVMIVVVALAIGGIAFLIFTQFPQLIPAHTIRAH